MSCDNCGRRTPRSKYCKQCAMDKRNESKGADNPSNSPKKRLIRKMQCGECEHTWTMQPEDYHECPECGYNFLVCLEATKEVVA